MINQLKAWLKERHAARMSIQADARRLIAYDERQAYYSAQRLIARARSQGNAQEMLRWARVAAEIARTSKVAEMDFEVVNAIAEEES